MKGAKARRERNRAEMKQSVLDAAQKLVGEKGIEGLSLRGIARELGYSPAAIYEYFESLEEIIVKLYYEGTDGLSTVLQDCCSNLSPETDAPSALIQLGEAFRQHAIAKPELYRFTYNVMKQPMEPEGADSEGAKGLEPVIRQVAKGIEQGELLDVDPFVITFAAWTAAHGFVSLEISGHFTWLHDVGVAEIEGKDAVSALYHQVLLGVVRGWTTDKGKALIPN